MKQFDARALHLDTERLRRGFTLIELLVVLAIVALLATIALPRYFNSLQHAKEVTLKQDLSVMRDTLDKFYADTGRYPATLDELVEKNYLRAVPVDPLTQSASSWIIVAPTNSDLDGVYDVKSGASGNTRDGVSFGDL
jgi:general secretion pathway protein G